MKLDSEVPGSISVTISMGALLLFFEQPLILIVVISVMMGLLLFLIGTLYAFMDRVKDVDTIMNTHNNDTFKRLISLETVVLKAIVKKQQENKDEQ